MSQLLSLKNVCNKISFSRAYVYKEISAGNFPAPIKFGKSSRWSVDAIDEWINNR